MGILFGSKIASNGNISNGITDFKIIFFGM
jgi:hypothetical protein